MSDDLKIPADITGAALDAAQAIATWARRRGGTGGCRTFYSPAEWKARGEEFGLESVLIVVHDGGALSDYNSIPSWRESLEATLTKLGLYAEPCTCWYTALYRI